MGHYFPQTVKTNIYIYIYVQSVSEMIEETSIRLLFGVAE
jgi:hypothetical protein